MSWSDLFKYPTTFFGILGGVCGVLLSTGVVTEGSIWKVIVGVLSAVSVAVIGFKAQDTKDLPK